VARGGGVKTRDEPERRCVVTRTSQPRAGLIRFVVGPGGEIVPDLAGRLPGRGIWVSADAKALKQAATKGLFARAAKQSVRVPPDLAERVEAMLARHLVDLIAMARKAGHAVAGLEKTKAALVTGQARLLIQAADGSARGRAELRPPAGENTLVSCLFGHELGLAFGRDNVIHAAVLAGGLSDRIRDEALRLAGLRSAPADAALNETGLNETGLNETGMDRRPTDTGVGIGLAGEGSRGKG
jgi:uncharacterized protein